MELYPLKFDPIFEYRIWGGENLKSKLGKDFDDEKIGESWEISAVKGKETVVSNGPLKGKSIPDLIHDYKGLFLGPLYDTGNTEFPLLIKFIDSAAPLSIQVHPDDNLAKKRHNSLGKNEMWYIMPSDYDASITVGFKDKISSKEYLNRLEDNSITEVLNELKVSEGDVFYIPAGRVHAIGSGVLLAEIQQSSNVTYRIYDYDRVDQASGKKRELHNDLAIDAVDFGLVEKYSTDYNRASNQANELVNSPFFKTNFFALSENKTIDNSHIDSFIIYMCVKGRATLRHRNNDYPLKMGECILIPACINSYDWQTENAELIEIYM